MSYIKLTNIIVTNQNFEKLHQDFWDRDFVVGVVRD